MLRTRILWASFRNYVRGLRGQDYFHIRQGLGCYFNDGQSYYNDLRGKAHWKGLTRDGVPLLGLSGHSRSIEFPIMILQFGLGSLDKFFETGQEWYLENARSVATWILSRLNEHGSFQNYFTLMEPGEDHISDNSAMAQGQALSFIRRAVELDLIAERTPQLRQAADHIATNMILPLAKGGTLLQANGETIFCETCRPGGYIVLNGWVFSLFGLYDYLKLSPSILHQKTLEKSVVSLQRLLPIFVRADGWTNYDNKGRLCSPFYHSLHCSLLEAALRLHWFEAAPSSLAIVKRIQAADSGLNRFMYTLRKAAEKVFQDGTRYLVVSTENV